MAAKAPRGRLPIAAAGGCAVPACGGTATDQPTAAAARGAAGAAAGADVAALLSQPPPFPVPPNRLVEVPYVDEPATNDRFTADVAGPRPSPRLSVKPWPSLSSDDGDGGAANAPSGSFCAVAVDGDGGASAEAGGAPRSHPSGACLRGCCWGAGA